MTDYKLWPATNGPDTAASDAAVTAGLQWATTRDDLFLKGYRYYRGTTAVRGSDVATWNHDTTSMISDSQTSFAAPTTTGWQEVLLSAPYPAVASGVKYVTGLLFTDVGDTANCHYTATTGYWSSGAGVGGIGDANLSAPDINGSAGGQGKFVAGSTLARPVTNANGINFWVEPILSDSDGSDGGGGAEEVGTVSAQFYASTQGEAFKALIDFTGENLVASLHTGDMTPSITAHSRVSDLTDEVPTGHGYVQGGRVVTGATIDVVTPADLAAWTSSTAYQVGDLIRPPSANGFLYRCQTAGTSGSSAPSWPTGSLADVDDGTAVWGQYGRAVVVFDMDDIPFGGITGDALYLVLSDRSADDAEDQPLIALIQFSEPQSGTSTFTYRVPDNGLIHLPVF